MSMYYDDIFCEDNPTQSAGWRHPIEQALRFEFALAGFRSWLSSTSLLDVGCGPGALFRYLQDIKNPAQYTGLDCYLPSIQLAQQLSPDGCFVVADVLGATRQRQQFDVVVAIGVLVDGQLYQTTIARQRRLLTIIKSICQRTSGYACVIVLKQEEIQRQPALKAEPALAGATRAELEGLMRHLSHEFSLRWFIEDDITNADRALYISCCDAVALPNESAWPAAQWRPEQIHERVLAGPWGTSLSPLRQAWYWWVVGQPARSLSLLGEPKENEPAEYAQLRQRVLLG